MPYDVTQIFVALGKLCDLGCTPAGQKVIEAWLKDAAEFKEGLKKLGEWLKEQAKPNG